MARTARHQQSAGMAVQRSANGGQALFVAIAIPFTVVETLVALSGLTAES